MAKVETEKGEEIVQPAPLQVALLYKILQAQREILQFLKETTAEGVDLPFDDKVVTAPTTINFIRDYPYRPLRKLYFFNKGPATVYIRVNEDGKEIPIEDREDYTVERPKPTIKTVTLRVEPGQSATLKIVGSY